MEKGQDSKEISTKEALIHIHNSDEFTEHALNTKLPCLVDFFSKNCPPCRILGPIISKLAEDYRGKAVVCKVSLDISENHSLAQQYGIRSIPTVLFFRNGKEVKRLVGLSPENTYRTYLDGMIQKKTDEDTLGSIDK